MIPRLVWRSLLRRPGRSALLLAGYALGVGVTVALLSIGSALLRQSRDRDLVGGGDLTVLPAGLDLETFRTGGASSLYFTLEQAPFLYRQVLAGERLSDRIRAAAPWIDDELLYLGVEGEAVPVAAAGEIPGRAAALGAGRELLEGRWEDHPADRRWMAPSDSALYSELDRFHLPPPEARGDSTWAEWHYFNVSFPGDRGWLHLTYLVTGAVPEGEWEGGLLATVVGPVGPDGRRPERAFATEVPREEVRWSTERPDLRLGASAVRLDSEGRYLLRAEVPAGPRGAGAEAGGGVLELELRLVPAGRRYLPPLEVSGGRFPSGYVVPVLRGRAEGRVCVDGECLEVGDAPAYHDHNWGVWREVTWDWGTADPGDLSILYGGVRRRGEPAGGRFLFLTDSLGFAGLLPVTSLDYRREEGRPVSFLLRSRRGRDSLTFRVEMTHVRATRPEGPMAGGERERVFYQMRGRGRLEGTLRGESLAAEGDGFFETWSGGEAEGTGR